VKCHGTDDGRIQVRWRDRNKPEPRAHHARTSTVILVFDEANGVFGKRSGFKDTPDHYANLKITYLLQRPEQQTGAVILTSNLNKDIDPAFLPHIFRFAEIPPPRWK
jgi:SpoVK/Ycf46/Vps4 family AAA+-type ATPase